MNSSRFQRHNIRSPFSGLMAHGEPWVWLMSGSLAFAVMMIVGLLLFITVRGSLHFWPRPLYEIILRDGETFLGEEILREGHVNSYQADEIFTDRRLVHTANFELTGAPYRWIEEDDIVIFPSKALHGTQHNKSNTERISISGDIVCIAKNSKLIENMMPPLNNWDKM